MRTAVITVGVAMTLIAAAPAAGADRIVATVARSTGVDADGGRAVWSAWDPAVHAYRLAAYARGHVRTLPIAPNPVPFDADIGPDAHGLLRVVFSRCDRSPVSTWALDGRRGCDLYATRIVGTGQFRLRGANGPADEYWPTIWGNRIAFTRTYRPQGGQTRRFVYWRNLTGGGPSHRLRRGSLKEGDAVPEELDMRGRRVAFVWNREFGDELRLASTDGSGRLLVRVPGSGAAADELAAQGPTLRGGGVDWMLSVGGDDPAFSEIRRVAVPTRRQQRANTRIDGDPSLPRATEGFAQDGGRSWYVRAAAANAYEIHLVTGLRYQPAPPIVLE